jgi:UDP-N-acetylglucosamine 3-dehydrogenase
MSDLRFLVVGVGRMGTNHVRVLSEMPGVKLAWICDSDRELAERTRQRFQAEGSCTTIEEAATSGTLDAAIIAVPTAEHLAAVTTCAQFGINVFLEKPMAASVEECDAIIDLTGKAGLKLMVGHIERFNPAIIALKAFLDEGFLGDLYCVETARTGPFPKRLYGSKDGVVIDLAVHDLDLVAYLFGDLTQLYANHITTRESHQDIHARVMFKTVKGIVGSSQLSWISPRKERSMTIYGDKGILSGNLIDQEVWYFENGDVGIDYSDNYYQNVLLGRVSEGKVVKFPIKKEEPLRSELASFCTLLRGGSRIDSSYGRNAVQYSLAVLRSAREDRIIAFTGGIHP